MSDTTKRRRWPWVLLAVVLLVVGGSIAWTFRPLNATERALVGRWRVVGDTSIYRFDANRRFENSSPFVSVPSTSSWSASDSWVCFKTDRDMAAFSGVPWHARLITRLHLLFSPPRTSLRWEGADRLWLNGVEFVRVQD